MVRVVCVFVFILGLGMWLGSWLGLVSCYG